MSQAKVTKKKLSFWQTLKAASGPYRRLYGYLKPYKVRFIIGLLLGFAYGGVTSLLPIALARVTSTIFHGAAPSPMAFGQTFRFWIRDPKSIQLFSSAWPFLRSWPCAACALTGIPIACSG